MVLGLNFASEDILNLFGIGCCGMINTMRFGSLGVKGLVMECKKKMPLGWIWFGKRFLAFIF